MANRDTVNSHVIEIKKKVSAIVMFGHPTPTSGFRPAEYYQVVIDPNMVSPEGQFIRFDTTTQGGELHGWQRIEAMTVCEVLGEGPAYKANPEGYTVDEKACVSIRALVG
jgi:hypothetical protein